MIDCCSIADPPEYDTSMEAEELPESLGDEFELTLEEKAKINQAAHWGRDLIVAARAGSQQALEDLRMRMHITEYQVSK